MMTKDEAKQLTILSTVMWDENPDDLGTVRELNPDSFLVDWQNGQLGFIDFQDAERVEVYQPKKEN